ncbi:MAG: ribonucleoside-diphosphate reductase, adenosylcobalamin-dependent [Dehalococcoidia bacterium]|nr:ribonucleoside-diphosphate reductase, adenosylcobalamin-dependent [Dehalococcoidia bacterium]|tara:strand:+ start:5452 stop:7926 length:2475 start_codon:yes stop_codon:yes gene_type:complete
MVQTNKSNLEVNRYGEINEEFEPAPISDNANVVLEKRYLLKDENDEIVETPNQMFIRVSKALSKPEKDYGLSDSQVKKIENLFYQSMASLEFLPNSPTLMNAGTGAGTLSACFVLPLTDSMEGIMKAAHDAAMVQKFGGGTGFSLSEIRPTGTPIATTHGKACGPIAVLKHLSSVSTLVTQGGKRDGANMAVMDVHHPNILDFIECKKVEGQIHNFNISVGASDQFMQAVKDGTDYPLLIKANPADPESEMVEAGRLDAREVFDKIVHGAWSNGEPGMVFLDEVNRNSPVRHVGRITATNPCGEQPLLPNESCNLGSIDVGKFVIESGENQKIDWNRLEKIIRLTTRFLDNVIDANKYAIPEIEEMNMGTRKLGLGIMGFADLLVKLGVPYDSEEGVKIAKELMAFFKEQSDNESRDLAIERGPFPQWKGSKMEKDGEDPYRNACRLTVAPTGTISMIAGASSGIEPIFSLAYRKHNILEGETLFYVDKNFENMCRLKNIYSDELMEYLSDGGSLLDREDVPNSIKELFHTAADISPTYHVLMQSAFQESTDAGISKTINFPNEATLEDVENAYMLAWETKCKGITVYRSGSREVEVLTSGHDASNDKTREDLNKSENMLEGVEDFLPQNSVNGYITPMDRPQELLGITSRVRTGRGNLYVTVNMAGNKPFEIFTTHGKAGGNDAAMAEAVSRVASLCLRSGLDPKEVISQLRGITDIPAWDEGTLVRSVPDALATVLDKVISDETKTLFSEGTQKSIFSVEEKTTDDSQNIQSSILGVEAKEKVTVKVPANNVALPSCPDCEVGSLAFEEGCQKCYSCGYSKC